MRTHRFRIASWVAVVALAAACGGDGDTATDPTEATEGAQATENGQPTDDVTMDDPTGSDGDMTMDDDMDMDGEMDMAGEFGEPAEAAEADRTIEVTVDNDFAFKPAEYDVAPGEVVTFHVTNEGDLEHEFVLGDEEAQDQMAEEMDAGDGHEHSGEMNNAVTIHSGEDAELTWRFPDEAMTVLVGCHVEGHWEAGMQGSVTVG